MDPENPPVSDDLNELAELARQEMLGEMSEFLENQYSISSEKK